MSSRRRTGLSDLAKGSSKEAAPAPAGPPTIAPIDTIAPNPDNPRDPGELDLEELMESLRQVGILQPIVVMSRASWLKLYPAHEPAVGWAEWVVVGGNRRLEAARALAWVRVPIHVRDNLAEGADDDEHFLDEAVMVENIHRKNLAPLKEAAFLQRLVERHGSQGKVAKRIGKTQAYVSQRLSLLNLQPALKQELAANNLRVKEARQLAALPPEQQAGAWEAMRAAPATHNPVMSEETIPTQAAPPAVVPQQQSTPAVEPAATASSALLAGETHNPVMTPTATEPPPTAEPAVPEAPRSQPPAHNPVMGDGGTWADPQWVHEQVRQHMTADSVEELVKLLTS